MRLRSKLLLGFGIIFALLFSAVEYYSYHRAMEAIPVNLRDEGRAIAGVVMAMRRVYHQQFLSGNLPLEEKTLACLPAHALTRISQEFRSWVKTGLTFNNVSDRPRNALNAANPRELEVIRHFRDNPDAEEWLQPFTGEDGKNYYHFARPLFLETYCMECHGERDAAPAVIAERYSEGFGYKPGELRGILSINLPADQLEQQIDEQIHTDLLAHLATIIAGFLMLYWLVESGIVERLHGLRLVVARFMNGDYKARSAAGGSDEISELAQSFDSMADHIAEREQMLRDSEARYRLLFEQANDPIILVDPATGQIVQFNEAAYTTLGYTKDEFAQLTAVGTHVLESADEVEARIRHVLEEGQSTFETRTRTKGGRILDTLVNARLITVRDKPYILSIVRDVTQHIALGRAVEKERTFLQTVIDGAIDPIMVIGADYRVLMMNKAARRFRSDDELSGIMLCHKISHHSDHPCSGDGHPCPLEDVRKSGRPATMIHEHVLANGERRLFELEASPLRNEAGEFIGIIETSRDITDRVIAEREVLRQKQQAEDYLAMAGTMIVALDTEGNVTLLNQKGCQILGFREGELIGCNWFDTVIPAEQREAIQDIFIRLMRHDIDNLPEYYENEVITRGGERRLIAWHNRVLRDESGAINGTLSSGEDITARRSSELTLRKLSSAIEQSPVAVVITDHQGDIEYVNPRFEQTSGYSQAEVLGRNPRFLKTGFTSADEYRRLWQMISSGETWWGELLNRRKSGELFWEYVSISPIKDNDGNITHYLGVKEDISVRKEYEERLLHQENYDALTDLPNRVLALDRLAQNIVRARREQRGVALVLVDLDSFKTINDSLGHAAGDELLISVARRLLAVVRDGDTVARLSGDEFLVILADMQAVRDAEAVVEKIRLVMEHPFIIDGQETFVTSSMGITVFPGDGDDPHVLLRNADAAMHRAKEGGKNSAQFFRPEMNQHAKERLAMEAHLRHALERDELRLHFQPQVVNGSGRLVGAEALLRWVNPTLGNVPPDDFIHLAEETGLITPIGDWVLQTACREARGWYDKGWALQVGVNVSYRQFRNGEIIASVKRALGASGLPPEFLELEITESVFLADVEQTGRIFTELKALGVRLALDDFGTGYSSLSYLKRFPFDVLKIDRSFVRDITDDPEDAALCEAIIRMAHSLKLKVVAEGVENDAQLEFVSSRGSDLIQGYYFGKPMPAEDFATYAGHRTR